MTALRRAFDATMKDPEFLADAQRTKLTVGPITGEELQKLVAEVSDLSPALAGEGARRLRRQDELSVSFRAKARAEPIRGQPSAAILLVGGGRCSGR